MKKGNKSNAQNPWVRGGRDHTQNDIKIIIKNEEVDDRFG